MWNGEDWWNDPGWNPYISPEPRPPPEYYSPGEWTIALRVINAALLPAPFIWDWLQRTDHDSVWWRLVMVLLAVWMLRRLYLAVRWNKPRYYPYATLKLVGIGLGLHLLLKTVL